MTSPLISSSDKFLTAARGSSLKGNNLLLVGANYLLYEKTSIKRNMISYSQELSPLKVHQCTIFFRANTSTRPCKLWSSFEGIKIAILQMKNCDIFLISDSNKCLGLVEAVLIRHIKSLFEA